MLASGKLKTCHIGYKRKIIGTHVKKNTYICSMKINAAIECFLNYIAIERRLSRLTVESYGNDLRLLATFLESKLQITDIEDVSHLEIREWLMAEQEKSPFTLKQYTAVLRSWFKYLRREGIVSSDVMAKVSTPKTPKRLPISFTEKEVSKIYDSQYFTDDFEGQRDQLMLRILYETGIRRAELIGLRESSLDEHAKSLKVLGKRDKERIIPIENELLHNIKCYFSLKREKVGETEAFFVRQNGMPFEEHDVAMVVKKYMTLFSNADRISPHVFRHSFATHLLNEGADINAIKELLGHTDLAATEVYTHVSRQYMQETYRHTHPRAQRKSEEDGETKKNADKQEENKKDKN